jgi:hypothetical protein
MEYPFSLAIFTMNDNPTLGFPEERCTPLPRLTCCVENMDNSYALAHTSAATNADRTDEGGG